MDKRKWEIVLWRQRSDKVPGVGICVYKSWSHVVVLGNHSWSDCILLRINLPVAASRNSGQGAAYGVVRQGVN
jgi:hypothetical protein